MKVLPYLLIPVTAAVPVLVPSANNEMQSKKQSKVLRPSELPIYDDECGCKHSHSDILSAEEKSSLEKGISEIRATVADVLNSFEDSKDRVVQFLEVGKEHTLDTVEYLREESNLLARIGVISASGLTGLLLGVRGGTFKKLLYASISSSAVASICYPKEANQIFKSGFTISKYYAILGYNKLQEELSARKETKILSSSTPKVASFEKIGEQKNVGPAPLKVKGDYGQGKVEDQDMYTTRR